jgi:hypothetical protein
MDKVISEVVIIFVLKLNTENASLVIINMAIQ